jgi:hypothetical protein
MPRPDLSRVPEYYHNYINQVPESDLMEAFRIQTPSFNRFLKELPADMIDYRYAEGKWTIKEMLQHIIDAERIFSYRALCFARKDATPLPSFDENEYAANAKADKRNWNDLQEEFNSVRRSTEILFASFDKEQLETSGTASGHSNYVLGIGFILAGHVNHHLKIIRERYLAPQV